MADVANAAAAASSATPAPRRRVVRGAGGRHALLRYALGRVLLLPVMVFGIMTVSFLILAALPGDVARVLLGPAATPAAIRAKEHALGLDQSIFVRYGHYVAGLFHGSLGRSYYTDTPITQEMGSRWGATFELVVPAVLLALLIGVGLGSVAAYFAGTRRGAAADVGLTVVQSLPDFLLGLILIFLLFSKLDVLPGPEGQFSFAETAPPQHTGIPILDALIAGQASVAGSAALHLVLPVLTLGLAYSVAFGRTARALLIPALDADYTRFARACGLPERRLILNALRAQRTSLLTYVAVVTAAIVGGAAVVEIVFSWNGLGQWAVQAMLRQDLPAVVGFVLVTAAVTVAVYLVLDLVSTLLDPRIRFDVQRGQ